MRRAVFLGVLAVLLCITLPALAAVPRLWEPPSSPHLTVDGRAVPDVDKYIRIEDGYSTVYARLFITPQTINEYFPLEATYDPRTGRILVTDGYEKYMFTVGQPYVYRLRDMARSIATEPFMYDNKVYLPLDDIAELFGYEVEHTNYPDHAWRVYTNVPQLPLEPQPELPKPELAPPEQEPPAGQELLPPPEPSVEESVYGHVYGEQTPAAPQTIRIMIGGQYVSSDVAPVVSGGRVMVPIRVVMESLGAQVTYLPASGEVVIESGGTKIVLAVGRPEARVAGRKVRLDAAPKIINGRTMVPVRFISEQLGYKVNWDERYRTVRVWR